ncbi:MAG: hypothetical protein ABIH86_04900 [Planctomycetota bacterium]
MSNFICALQKMIIALIAIGFLAGCGSPYPGFESTADTVFPPRPAFPDNQGNQFRWRAVSGRMATYFGKYDATIRATQCVINATPETKETIWSLTATTDEGIGIGYLGVIVEYQNENNSTVKEILPAFDLSKAADGLYVCIDDGFSFDDNGQLSAIRPVAHIIEIRENVIRPYDYPIRLVPETPTDLTPMPETEYGAQPRGTPIVIGQ